MRRVQLAGAGTSAAAINGVMGAKKGRLECDVEAARNSAADG
jgi:hypothetical protein